MSKSGIFPDNRFAALDELLKLLGFSRYEWQSLFKVLSRADCGFLEFCIGDVEIEVYVGSGDSIGEGEGDWIRIIFRVTKDNVEKSAIYTFEMRELRALGKEEKLKIENFMKECPPEIDMEIVNADAQKILEEAAAVAEQKLRERYGKMG